jgi:hypothetical protein
MKKEREFRREIYRFSVNTTSKFCLLNETQFKGKIFKSMATGKLV